MKVLVIGANGKIGSILMKKLHKTTHPPRGMYRELAQINRLPNQDMDTVVGDLESDFDHAFQGIDAVVFTAGSGGHTPAEKTDLIDRRGAKKAIDLAIKHNVKRFIMVSALGADRPSHEWPNSMAHYFAAKADADQHLRQSNLDYTILMPGMLNDDHGTNNVEMGEVISRKTGSITRTDVATVIQACLDHEGTYQKSLKMLNGDTPIPVALAELDAVTA